MGSKVFLPIIVVVGLIILLLSSMFTVKEYEQALVFQFGEAKRAENVWGTDSDAGLKFKTPFVQNVVYLSRRNLDVDLDPVELLGSDQERLIVDAFVRYRITDPIQFYKELITEDGARSKLQGIVSGELRAALANVETSEIISGQRAELMNIIQRRVAAKMAVYGVEIIDVRIKRADLPQENYARTLERMVTERKQEASLSRARGEEQAQTIRATADKEAQVIRANAQKQAEIIQGEGDKKRNNVYAEAYNKDPEFFAFYRSMEAYRKGLKSGTNYILSPDSDFLSYLDNQGGPRR